VAFSLTDQDIIDLPVDQLGLAILQDMINKQTWNDRNWVLEIRSGGGHNSSALNAIAEGIAWLRSACLIARDFSQSSSDSIVVTRLGRKVAQEGLASVRAGQRLAMGLHRALEEASVSRHYLTGDYEVAAFAAMKAVEVRVRSMAKAPDSLLGVKLMREAFNEGGSLRNPDLDRGEQVERMERFAGSIGLIKNPTSHHDVRYDDPTEAAEIILLADLLMRMLDRIAQEASS